MPVEYKHGRAKASDADRLQLCAQAMALEDWTQEYATKKLGIRLLLFKNRSGKAKSLL